MNAKFPKMAKREPQNKSNIIMVVDSFSDYVHAHKESLTAAPKLKIVLKK